MIIVYAPGADWVGSMGAGREAMLQRAVATMGGASRAVLTRRGADITASVARTSALVVSPHPDDETLACGATVLRKTDAGAPVGILVASDGGGSHPGDAAARAELVALRRQEAVTAAGLLGVAATDVSFGDLPDGGLTDRMADLVDLIAAAVAARMPAELYVPVSCDGHPDHDAVSAAGAMVARIYPDLVVREYPVWLWTHWPFTRTAAPRRSVARRVLVDPVRRATEVRPSLVSTGDGYLARKQAAIGAYRTQVQEFRGHVALNDRFLAHFDSAYEVFFAQQALAHLGERAA